VHVIVGLGNPGARYAETKHNFGFNVINVFARNRNLSFRAGRGSYVYTRSSDGLILVKPTSYMNLSGPPVIQALNFFNADSSQLLVVYDDIDLPLGSIRFRGNGSSAGHKGMESIIQALGSVEFNRMRMGIATDAQMKPSEKYVLKPFRKSDMVTYDDVVETSVQALDYYVKNPLKDTMNQYNKKYNSVGEKN